MTADLSLQRDLLSTVLANSANISDVRPIVAPEMLSGTEAPALLSVLYQAAEFPPGPVPLSLLATQIPAGIREKVMALAAELADVDIAPPLAVGLAKQIAENNSRRLITANLELALQASQKGEPVHCYLDTIRDLQSDRKQSRIAAVGVMEFMKMDFPPRENILAPWLPCQGLAMAYAPRGVGKTHFSLGVGYATASGGEFLGWKASKARGVLFLDGEMPAVALKERIARIAASADREPDAPFRFITPDLQPSGMIDLARAEDRADLQHHLDGIDLIIVDNLSTLCRSGKEAEGESWLPVQQWALQQRAAGRSVLFIHHAGKNGEQRGTSRREDVLDTVIALKRPAEYTPDMGACFEVHYEKARGLYGDDTKPFEARLVTAPGGLQQSWAIKSLDLSTAEKVANLLKDGLPQIEIAEMLGMTRGAISKAAKKATAMGLLT